MRGPGWCAPFVLLLAACGPSKYALQEDEIHARDVELPDGARAGMFVTWRTRMAGEGEGAVVEATMACVGEAPLTIEWRVKRDDGRVDVTAARFARDGTVFGAWRGRAGATGRPLKVVGAPARYAEGVDEEVQRQARRLGMDAEDTDLSHRRGEEEIETPAGTFACVFDRVSASVLLTRTTVIVHVAKQALPLSRLVRADFKGPMGLRFTQELFAYGEEGAVPLLRIPE